MQANAASQREATEHDTAARQRTPARKRRLSEDERRARAEARQARADERRAREEARQARAEQRRQRRAVDRAATSPHVGVKMPPTPGPSEPSTAEVGADAEAIAVRLLAERGYQIVERNYRCKVGELDIVAIDGEVMVFVEVRSRASDDYGDAIESVGRRKQRKVMRVAEVYLLDRRPRFAEYRFDVVAINGDDVALYADAWRGGLLL